MPTPRIKQYILNAPIVNIASVRCGAFMVYSPLRYTDRIFASLKEKGFIDKVPLKVFYKEIIEITLSIRPLTIKNLINVYVILGYIELSEDKEHWIIKYEPKTEPEKPAPIKST